MGNLSKVILNIVVDEQKRQGMTTTELTKRAACSMKAMEYWKKGERNMSLTTAEKVLDALGLELKVEKKNQSK